MLLIMDYAPICKQVLSDAIIALKAFDSSDINKFQHYAEKVYNTVALDIKILENIENHYLLGEFYSYLEGAFRDTRQGEICFENACYCFYRAIQKDKTSCTRQKAAMRMFILTFDNGIGFSEFIGFIRRKYPLRTIKSNSELEQSFRTVLYRIFENSTIHSYLDEHTMRRFNYVRNVFIKNKNEEQIEESFFTISLYMSELLFWGNDDFSRKIPIKFN